MVNRTALLCACAAVALLLVPAAAGGPLARELMPGVTYTRQAMTVSGRSVTVHLVVTPRPAPGSLYELKPVLSNGTITGGERLTSMQDRIAPLATTVGVNGDLYNVAYGFPTGIFMRDGVLHGRPTTARSTLGIGLDGLLRVARIGFYGTWGPLDGERTALDQLNRPADAGQTALFTPSWGSSTPRDARALDVVLSGVPQIVRDTDISGVVAEVREGGDTPIPPGGAVLQAVGSTRAGLASVALPGQAIVLRATLKPWWEQVADAIGGGPALVRKGQLALPTTEQFSSSQLLDRQPRTAVGQRADGSILLVTVDGRSRSSTGVTMRELGELMLRLGAVTAMSLDGGGGSTLAVDGSVLNRPSDGSERAVSNALMLFYYGAYAPAPTTPVVSPNGDGVAESQELAYKLVRPSEVDVRLIGPNGTVIWRESGPRQPGTYRLEPDLRGRTEGLWRWEVQATDTGGTASRSTRTFRLNNTLAALDLDRERVRRGKGIGFSFELAHNARVVARVETAGGSIVRTILQAPRKAGMVELRWDGKDGGGHRPRAGEYVIRVLAANRFGDVALGAPFAIVRR